MLRTGQKIFWIAFKLNFDVFTSVFKGILINYLYLTQKYLFEIGLLKKFHFQAKHVCSLWLVHYQRKLNSVLIFGIKFLLACSLVLYNSKCLFPMVFCLYIVYTLGFFFQNYQWRPLATRNQWRPLATRNVKMNIIVYSS